MNRSFDNFLSIPMNYGGEGGVYQPHAYQLHQLQQHQHNWPKCIPTSPFHPRVNRTGNFYTSASRESLNSSSGLGKLGSLLNGTGGGGAGGGVNGGFDLDQLEKECRMSHASLFQNGPYQTTSGLMSEYSKSTAV